MKNSCEGKSRLGPVAWKTREDAILHCTYCGGIHPKEFVRLLNQADTRFSGSDWKYGFPHKFYLEPVNPKADEIVEVGSSCGPEIDGSDPGHKWRCKAHVTQDCACPKEGATGYFYQPIMGKRPHLFVKFYTSHLADATDDEFQASAELSERLFGIRWEKSEEGIRWIAPRGTQLNGVTA